MKTKTRLLKWEKTITVTAVYDGMDKANYKTLSVEIKVTGIECTHTDESQREIRNKVEATCTEDGYTGDIFCTNCQTLIRSGEIVNASGHQWKEEYTTDQTATCTDRGSKSIHCSKCDAIKEGSTEIIMALGHTGGAATCSERAICSRCRNEYGDYNKSRHMHMELRDKEEPTSEKEGYTGDTYCLDCNTLLTKGDKIPKVSQTTTEDKKTEDSSLAAEDKKITDSQQVTKLPSAGTKLEDEKSGAVYEVTMANQAERTVTYLKPVDAEEKNITVPATMTMDGVTYKVTVVAENAFKNNKKIEKVTIEKNVTDIEEKAFYGCSNLKNVSLGSDVNVIGESAFSGCKNLNKVSLNKNLIVIDDKAFYRCTKLSGVTIPSKVKIIGEGAFYGCKNLKKITIKTTKLTNKNVGKKAFKGISSKAVIKVPKNKAADYKKLLQSRGISPKIKIKK